MQMKDLISASLIVRDGTVTCSPHDGKERSLHVSDIATEHNKCFAVNNSIIAFVRNNQMYVTPYTEDKIRALKNAKYHQRDFHVPFSNWDYPRDNKEIWDNLCANARAINTAIA